MRIALVSVLLLLAVGCRPPTTVPDPVPVEEEDEGPSVERMEGVAWRYCLDWLGTLQCKVSCEEVDRWSAGCIIRSYESYALVCTEDEEGGLWCLDEQIDNSD